MPTIIFVNGWRLYFFSNENQEPIHVHVEKGDMACKYWLNRQSREVSPAWSYNMTGKNKRAVETIINDNFDLILWFWDKHFYL